MKGDEVAVWRANDKVKLNYKEYLKLFLLVSMISENNEKLLVRTSGLHSAEYRKESDKQIYDADAPG